MASADSLDRKEELMERNFKLTGSRYRAVKIWFLQKLQDNFKINVGVTF